MMFRPTHEIDVIPAACARARLIARITDPVPAGNRA